MCRIRGSLWIVQLTLILWLPASAGTPGSFRGTIVKGPHPGSEKNWIYIESRNGMARRVEVSHARVTYAPTVPAADRSSRPQDALAPGAVVRVTGEQGSDGEWKAGSIEILRTGTLEKASGRS